MAEVIDAQDKVAEVVAQNELATAYQGGTPFRKNYAGIGMTYDPIRDAFIPPKPFDDSDNPRLVFDEDKCIWMDTLHKDINM